MSPSPRQTDFATLALGIPLGALALSWMARSVNEDGKDPVTAAVFAGVGVLAILLGLIFSVLAVVQGCRGRESLGKAVGVGLLNIILAAVCVSGFISARENTSKVKLAMEQVDKQREKTINKLASGENLNASDVKEMSTAANRLMNSAGSNPMDEKIRKAASATITAVMEESADYATATEQCTKAGGVRPRSLTSVDVIEQRIGMVQRLIKKNDHLIELVTNLPETLNNNLAQYGIDEPRRHQLAAQAFANSNMDLILKGRQLEKEIFTLFLKQLQLLKDSWGKWSVDPQSEKILFENTETLKLYNQLGVQINDMLNQQNQVQQEVVTRIRAQQAKNAAKPRQ